MARSTAVLAFVWACDTPPEPPPERPPSPGTCTGPVAVPNAQVPTAVTFQFTTSEPGLPFVRGESRGEAFDAEGFSADTEHALSVSGLVAGATYTWTAGVLDRSGGVATTTCSPARFTVPASSLEVVVTISDPRSEVAGEHVLFSTLEEVPRIVIIDGAGRTRFLHTPDLTSDQSVLRARATPGVGVEWLAQDRDPIAGASWIEGLGFGAEWTSRLDTPRAHHDFTHDPYTSSWVWLTYDLRSWLMDPTDGPSDQATHCPDGLCPIAGEALTSYRYGSYDDPTYEEVQLFTQWDTGEPRWACDHGRSFSGYVPDAFEWSHATSLAWDPATQRAFVLGKFDDTLYAIDAGSGGLWWRLGGVDSDFALVEGEWFDHGYLSDVWDGGFLVYETGEHRGWSRVSEYAWDETTREVRQVWVHDHPEHGLAGVLGDARLLPGGNRLVTWPLDRLIQEITVDGEILWEARIGTEDAPQLVARASLVNQLQD